MTPILAVSHVTKTYGAFSALKDVSFSVDEGEVFAIIGPNGAGKTTLFKVMTGEAYRTSGSITLRGEEIAGLTASERVQLGIARTFQVARIFPHYTAFENIVVAIEARARMNGETLPFYRVRPRADIRAEAAHRLDEMGLGNAFAMEARHLSLGDRKRLEFALTLALDPALLMLDEPTAGMSSVERHGIIDLIARVRQALGLTIVLTEHDMDFVFRLSGRLMVMNQGEVVAVGAPAEIRDSKLVQEIYLGKELARAHD